MKKPILHRYVGDKAFYKNVNSLLIPMAIQTGITNFVGLLDNLMVGRLGTVPMSAVAIANQINFVFYLAVFGLISGASIFGAQYFGVKDHDGIRYTFRFKNILGVIFSFLFILAIVLFSNNLVMLFLNENTNTAADIANTLKYSREYFMLSLFGILPFMILQSYVGTMRDMGITLAPMYAGVLAVITNLILNYLLIFGNFGFPKMGVAGAALATAISRYIELAYVVIHVHKRPNIYKFIVNAYKSIYIPWNLIKKILITGSPLIINETLYSLGQTFINQSYSTRGISSVAAVNIYSTVWALFCIIMFSMGSAISILVGQQLGKGDIEKARDTDTKLIFMTFVIHIFIGAFMFLSAPYIPLLYNTEPEVRYLAMNFLKIGGVLLPIQSILHCAYFTIRSGGKTFITFLFDSVYLWVVPATIAFYLCRHTDMNLIYCFLFVQLADLSKIFIALPMVKSGFWANNIIDE